MFANSNRWLGLAYKWLMPLALVAAIGVAAVTVISASAGHGGGHLVPDWIAGSEGSDGEQSEDGDCDREGKRRGHWGHRGHGLKADLGADVAELVGTDLDGLKSALADGMTLAEIAEANGVDVQTVIDALVARANERIDAAVEAGKLSEDEAETLKAEAAEKIEDRVNNGPGERAERWGKFRWRGHS